MEISMLLKLQMVAWMGKETTDAQASTVGSYAGLSCAHAKDQLLK